MLEGFELHTYCQDAPNQSLFHVKTKNKTLNLGAASPSTPFVLASDLEKCLEPKCEKTSDTFEVDFTCWAPRLYNFVMPANKLKILPALFGFSELNSFAFEESANSMAKFDLETQKAVGGEKKHSGLNFISQLNEKLLRFLISGYKVAKQELQYTSGILSGAFGNRSYRMPSIKTLIDGLTAHDTCKIQSTIDKYLPIERMRLSQETYETVCKEFEELKQHIALNYHEYESGESSEVDEKENPSDESQSEEPQLSAEAIDVEETSSSYEEAFQKEVTAESRIEPTRKLGRSTEINTKMNTFDDIADPIDIQETGVQIFRKPTKLFVFDNLKQWRKKGEGQMEIWKHLDSGHCYMLLWDKSSGNLLVHVRLDGKWNINDLANSTNSCRWAYYNYASCPEGKPERLVCLFRDADVAAQFMSVVAKCVAKSRLV